MDGAGKYGNLIWTVPGEISLSPREKYGEGKYGRYTPQYVQGVLAPGDISLGVGGVSCGGRYRCAMTTHLMGPWGAGAWAPLVLTC